MTKKELVAAGAAEANVEKKVADAVVSQVFDSIINALKDGEKVQILGFGTFETKDVAERDGRNPLTGEAIKIAACKKPAFSASKALKDALNG